MIAQQQSHLAPAGWGIGTPLRQLLEVGPLTVPEAIAVVLAVLSALAETHKEGRHHGGVSADSVGLGDDGFVLLAAEASRRRGSRAADLRATGELFCSALGVGLEFVPGARTPEAERSAPALVALGRSLAQDGGWTAEGARVAVIDAAGLSATESEQSRALADLAGRAAGAAEVERAVTRIVPGPPLGTEAATGPPRPKRRLAALAAFLFAGQAALPSLSRRHLPTRWGGIFGAMVVAGALVGTIAGLALGRPMATATPARAAVPVAKHPQTKPAVPPPTPPQSLNAASPDAAVSEFFKLVQEQRLDEAALLWTSDMSAAVDLATRFGGVQSVNLQRNEVVNLDQGSSTAVVAVDWTETDADGSTHEYAGQIMLSGGRQGWRWLDWSISEVAQPGSDGDGG